MSAVLQPGLISQANETAYIKTERTKIACAVYVLTAIPVRLALNGVV